MPGQFATGRALDSFNPYGEQYQIKKPKPFGSLVSTYQDTSDVEDAKAQLKRIEEKLDRLLSAHDYVEINGLWRKP